MLVAKSRWARWRDIWFGGQTMNPWLLEEGASGSSAGPGAATAAALVAFSVGSETGGSIVSPAMRCGVTGMRPTFGRVPRSGAMTLCWSLDKLGPMTRSVEDAMLVLQAIAGPDAGDPSSVPSRLDFDAAGPLAGLKVGYIAGWMKESPATDVDRAAMETMRRLQLDMKEVTLPDWPYGSLMPILFAEGAAAFEELALTNQLGAFKMVKARGAEPVPAGAISLGGRRRAGRPLRRKVALEMARIFREVDVLMVPSLRDEQLTITNFTGHPSLTLRAGFVKCRKRAAIGRRSGEPAAEVRPAAAGAALESRWSGACSTTGCSGASALRWSVSSGWWEKPAGF